MRNKILIRFILVALLIVAGVVSLRKAKEARTCAFDGAKIKSIFQVDISDQDGGVRSFCSVYCARRWHQGNKPKIASICVRDEVTAKEISASEVIFVESKKFTTRHNKCRIHTFANKDDALRHAQQYQGKIIENPFR